MRRVITAALPIALTCVPFLAAQQGRNAERGKRLFVENGCYQCHAYGGQGGGAGHLEKR